MRLPLPLLLAACATTATTSTPPGGPRGLRASEHLDEAHHHEEQAAQRWRWPTAYGDRIAYTIPWTRSWDSAADDERLAALHKGQAAQLEAAYQEACGERSVEQAAISPLQRYGIGGWNTSNGVILYLTPDAGMPDQLMAAIKCHRAWMMLAPSDMESCPLDLPDIAVDARGDTEGISVSITTRNARLVEELHRRAAHELEAASTRHH